MDHIISFLKDSCPDSLKNVILLFPDRLTKLTSTHVAILKTELGEDLPAPTEIEQEILR